MVYVNGAGKTLSVSGAVKSNATRNADGSVSTGNADNNALHSAGYGSGVQSVMTGGDGDDTYHLWSKATVAEKAGGGIDTVYSHIEAAYLPDHVENLTLSGASARFGFGNALDNVLTAGDTGSELNGGLGDDVIVGGKGVDTVIVRKGEGSDAVYNFNVAQDNVRLSGFGYHDFADLKARMTQTGADVTITLSDDQKLVLRDTQVDALSAKNFELELDRSTLKLTFEENFDKLVTQSQGGFWRTDWGNGGTNDNYRPGEVGAYVNDTFQAASKLLGVNPFSIDNGVLAITAKPAGALSSLIDGRTYTTGVLSTKDAFSQKYGYFEIRATLPEGKGFLPAFWLKSADGRWPPELDVVEAIGDRSDTIYMSSHTAAETGSHTFQTQTTHVDSSEPHTYGMNWTKDSLVWYIDGVEVARYKSPTDATAEFYMMINLAVGGSWPGAPDATTGTGQFKVDYVRVYANSDTESYTSKGETFYLNDSVPHTQGTFGDDLLTGGTGADVMDGRAGNDRMFGGAGNDTLTGGAGNDLLDGGTGADDMAGGDGDDIYYVDNAGDRVSEYYNNGKGGYDKVFASVDYTLTANVEDLTLIGTARSGTGTEQDNILTANDLGNTLRGLGGHDTLNGGRGDDILDGGAGNDKLYGGAGNDRMYGGDGYDVLYGGDGNDVIDGGAHNDTLYGDAGEDKLYGGPGNDTLIGGYDADFMAGGQGDDQYHVDHVGDVIEELFGEGYDRVRASVDYTLSDHVEELQLVGPAITGIGNAQNNTLYGNENDNRLFGGGGDDVLTAGLGNDLLDGGTGADRMTGGDGDDTYYVDNVRDSVIEFFNGGAGGYDKVFASVDYTLTANVEDLTLTGSAIRGTGNAGHNVITGNDMDNILNGGDGNDTIYGGAGNDTIYGGTGWNSLYGGTGNDTIHGGSGNETLVGDEGDDQLFGYAGDDRLIGGDGNDVLNGGVGADRMEGGDGDDIYYVDNARDTVTEYFHNGQGGRDKVFASIDYVLGDHVEDLTLIGNAVRATGNALDNFITGNKWNNGIDGGAGNDRLSGGGGADTFLFSGVSGNDVITDFDWDDRIDLRGWFADGVVDMKKLSIVNGEHGAIVSMEGHGSIELLGVAANELSIKSWGMITHA
ncbi:family 16 glycosylhydrolase [Sphingomonas hankookensis]